MNKHLSNYHRHKHIGFSRCGFWQGWSSILNIWGAPPMVRKVSKPFAADSLALQSDWAAIGRDCFKGLNKL
ncbi:MAG: hypothetical protein U0T84_06325 [Chitinophagales bacterium]